MSEMRVLTLGAATALWITVVPLCAHHSIASEFDLAKHISLTGTLTQVEWSNPHVSIAVQIPDADGRLHPWTFQSNPPSWYQSVGLTRDDLAGAIGKAVTIEAARARNDSATGFLQKMMLPDGRTLQLFTAPGKKNE